MWPFICEQIALRIIFFNTALSAKILQCDVPLDQKFKAKPEFFFSFYATAVYDLQTLAYLSGTTKAVISFKIVA